MLASMLDDPNLRQTMNEALNNPDLINMMIQNTPMLRNNPNAREMIQSPEFRNMMTNPDALRQAAQLRRAMGGMGGGAGAFPAPGVTDTTPAGAAGSTGTNTNIPQLTGNPFAIPSPGAGNPFAQLFAATGGTPTQTPPPPGSAGQGTPSTGSDPAQQNPFASLFGGGMGQISPEQIQQMARLLQPGSGAGGLTPEQLQHMTQLLQPGATLLGPSGEPWGSPGSTPASTTPADTRPPEERYADQLRQLNDMGFFDFDRNVEALRRSGGSVQGAIEQLLS